ncbi:MAG: DUF6036 family nucleotidyltransferase [Sedimentisphaeraceae bacterium JB056]
MFEAEKILKALYQTDQCMKWEGDKVELLLIGGAAAILSGLLPQERVTQDCDVMDYTPSDANDAIVEAAAKAAEKEGLPENWLSFQAMGLDVLPDGWRVRRQLICEFDKIKIYAASRIDLIAMKFYANRPQDREDILNMRPTKDELSYIEKYLNMLKLPKRKADLDQIVDALRLVSVMRDIDFE